MEEKDFTLIKRELVEALFIIGEEREFFELVCKHLAGITGAEACCVFLLAEDGNFKFTAGYNFPEEKSLQLLASVEKDFAEKEKIVLDKEKLGFPSIVYFSFFSGKKPLGFSVLCSKKEHFSLSRELLFKLGEIYKRWVNRSFCTRVFYCKAKRGDFKGGKKGREGVSSFLRY